MIYLKKKKILHKDSLDILGLDVYSIYTPFAPFNVGKEARNRFEGETQKVSQWRTSFYRVSILPRIRGRSHVHSPCLACVAFWNTRLDKTASARSRQKASKGSWSTVNRCQRDKLAEKTSEKAPETQPDDPVCETRIRYPAPLYLPLPSFSSSPLLLLLLLSSSSSSSPRDQQSRRVFLRASKVGCTCYRFNYVRTCGPCVLRSSPTLLSIANETWRNVVRSCKSLGEKSRR